MAALETPEPLGYAPGDPVTSAQMNRINIGLPKAPNWVDGGATYNPTDQLVMGGAGMRWTGPTEFGATSTTTFESASTTMWESGSSASFASGSTTVWESGSSASWEGLATFVDGSTVVIELDSTVDLYGGITVQGGGGVIDFNSGAELHFDSGSTITGSATLPSGASLTGNTGSTVQFSGTFQLAGGTNVELAPARSWTRHGCRLCAAALDGGGTPFTDQPLVLASFGVSSKGPRLYVQSFAAPSTRSWIELDDLPHGQTVTTVTLRTEGELSITTLTRAAIYRVVRWKDDDNFEYMSNAVNDSHTSGTWGTAATQTLTINAHATIDRAYRYGVEIYHHEVDTPRTLFIWGATATGTYSSLVT
jgi:hypothetical protein